MYFIEVCTLRDVINLLQAAYGFVGRDAVSVIFYFQLLFDMALFLILLSDSVTLIFTAHTISTNYVLIMVTGTISLILLTVFGLTMNSVIWLSVTGTISTLLMFAMIIVCSSYDSVYDLVDIERFPSITKLNRTKMYEFKTDSASLFISSAMLAGHSIINQFRVFGILRYANFLIV